MLSFPNSKRFEVEAPYSKEERNEVRVPIYPGSLGMPSSPYRAPVSVFAQTTGTVEGAVTDQSNAPLPGVTVELTSPNLQGSRTAVTSADGRYRFPAVPPGAYKVTAELAGFGKVEKRATVNLDSTATGEPVAAAVDDGGDHRHR